MTEWNGHEHCWHPAQLTWTDYHTERCCICGAVTYVLHASDRMACGEKCRMCSDLGDERDAFEKKARV